MIFGILKNAKGVENNKTKFVLLNLNFLNLNLVNHRTVSFI